MLYQIKIYLLVCVVMLIPGITTAQTSYAPAKVVYDIASADAAELSHIIDRIALLQNVYQHDTFDASIVLVVHEGAIPLFVKHNNPHYALRQRVKSLTLNDIIQIRVCEASARMQKFVKEDFESFIQMVPMADAEIIKLQSNGYAYLK